MDAFIDSVAWHYMAFLRTGNGDFYRTWFEGREPRMQRLFGDESEYHEPLAELRKRALEQKADGEK